MSADPTPPAADAPATSTAVGSPEVALVVGLQRALAARGKPAAAATVHGLAQAIQQAHALRGAAAIRIDPDEETLYFEEVPVTSRRSGRAIVALVRRLKQRGIAAVRFSRALTDAETDTFADLVQTKAAGLEPAAACRKVVEGLWSTGLRGTVDVTSLEQYGHTARTIKVEAALYPRLVYARLLTLLADQRALGTDKELRRHFTWRLTKAVQHLVSMAPKLERELLGFVRRRGADTFLVEHGVNTAILAVLLGQRIGLPRDLLCQVGLAGLLCWSGKSRTPPAVINKPAQARTADEAKEYGRHPYRALGALLELRRLEEPLVLAALVALQFDARKGCPPRRKPWPELHPLAQLVGLCEAFDAAMYSKPGAPPRAPHAVLDGIIASRRSYDPTLVQLFVGLVGDLGSIEAAPAPRPTGKVATPTGGERKTGAVPPKAEAPKAEAPTRPEAPRAEVPKPEASKAEAPKPETPKPDAPKPAEAKAEAPKPEAPMPDPKPEAPKPAEAKADEPKSDALKRLAQTARQVAAEPKAEEAPPAEEAKPVDPLKKLAQTARQVTKPAEEAAETKADALKKLAQLARPVASDAPPGEPK